MQTRTSPLRASIVLPNIVGRSQSTSDLPALAVEAEQLGYQGLWLMDHLALPGANVMDPIVTAAAVLQATTATSVGFMLQIGTRQPWWAAKQLQTLLHLAKGRLEVAIGVGQVYPTEWQAVGVNFATRGARTDEVIDFVLAAVGGDELAGPDGGPELALQPGATPFKPWIGGASEKALRRVARVSGRWIPSLLPAPAVAERLETIASMCSDSGHQAEVLPWIQCAVTSQPQGAIDSLIAATRHTGVSPEETAAGMLAGEEAAIVDKLHVWIEQGFKDVLFRLSEGDWRVQAEALARCVQEVNQQL